MFSHLDIINAIDTGKYMHKKAIQTYFTVFSTVDSLCRQLANKFPMYTHSHLALSQCYEKILKYEEDTLTTGYTSTV